MQPKVYLFELICHWTFINPILVYERSFETNQQQTYMGQVFMLDGQDICLYIIIPSLTPTISS